MTGKGAAREEFWANAPEADLATAWRRLRAQRRAELGNADSAMAVQAAGIEGLDAAALQARLCCCCCCCCCGCFYVVTVVSIVVIVCFMLLFLRSRNGRRR